MDTQQLREAIGQVFHDWEAFPGPLSHFIIVSIMDEPHQRYLLQQVSKGPGLQTSRTLAHLEIKDGKIWVEGDGTERGIANDLVTVGVPKNQIVLAFYPVAMREIGDFAVT